jgi:hypothetical protein
MLVRAKVIGTITVHALDDQTFRFVAEPNCVMLPGELHVSDQRHCIAAHIIARALQKLVVWQDLCGTKHFVKPDTALTENFSFLDPRDESIPQHARLH